MPKIIPIKDLKNTVALSKICHESQEPIYVTKNGYGDMVIMSMSVFEKMTYMDSVAQKVEQGEKDISEGKCSEGLNNFDKLREHINFSDILEIKDLPSGHLRNCTFNKKP